MAFTEADRDALTYLKKQFPRATFIEDQDGDFSARSTQPIRD